MQFCHKSDTILLAARLKYDSKYFFARQRRGRQKRHDRFRFLTTHRDVREYHSSSLTDQECLTDQTFYNETPQPGSEGIGTRTNGISIMSVRRRGQNAYAGSTARWSISVSNVIEFLWPYFTLSERPSCQCGPNTTHLHASRLSTSWLASGFLRLWIRLFDEITRLCGGHDFKEPS